MFADDLVLLSETPDGLQSCLDKLQQYTKKWKLEINLKKTKIMIFQNPGRRPEAHFYLGNQPVDIAQSYKYLGTIVTDTGNFKANEINIKKKGLRASYIILKNIGLHAKPSTSIRIFEKVVEPILTYNCEVSQAYFPKTWNYDKFIKNMWDTGSEINQVLLSFLRQIIGVRKKTCNIAILSETGKHPIALKIFNAVAKYWLRLHACDGILLQEARDINKAQTGINWNRMINHLIKKTGIKEQPSKNPKINDKILSNFKTKIHHEFSIWWKEKKNLPGKLDFYFKHKNEFRFEPYLDSLPRNIRIYVTRLRTSSHNFPVEILRYSKNKPAREERKCNICSLNEMGDELHYLLRCSNIALHEIRTTFLDDIKQKIPQFEVFSAENIIQYCLSMADRNTNLSIAIYAKKIIQAYRLEKSETPVMPTITRSGRLVKKTDKLNL